MTNCKLRAATAEDREQLLRWIAGDSDHRETTAPAFFYEREPGVECMALEDERGTVLYFRLTRQLRVDVQFGPTRTRGDLARNRAALKEGFSWLLIRAQQAGYRQLIFRSTVRPLIRFCERWFGFCGSPAELVREIAPLDTQQPR